MVKLFYSSTSCSAASFTAAYTAGLNIECEQVDISSHIALTSKTDFYTINPKGNVPALVLDDGTVINEGLAVLQYLADQSTSSISAPIGSSERYQIATILSWTASELHAICYGLFFPSTPPEVVTYLKEKTHAKYKYMEENLVKGKKFAVGDSWTIADAYLALAASWSERLKLDMSPYPNIRAYIAHNFELPNVKASYARMAEDPRTVV